MARDSDFPADNYFPMLYNYLKLSIRSLLKSPLFSSLNVLGLSLGLAVSMLLFLQVQQELSFDRYNTHAGQIYRVAVNAFWDPAHPKVLAEAPNAVGPAMKENVPAVEQFARVLQHEFGESAFITAGANRLVEENLRWADPGLADIFDFKILAGDLKAALSQPNTVAMSRSTALRYFGTTNPMGQTILIDQMPPLTVQAVYEDMPYNSSFNANVLGSFKTMKWAHDRLVWSNSSFETWLRLNPGADYKEVERQMAQLLDKNVPKENQSISLWLQPLQQVHLFSSHMDSSPSAHLGDPKEVGILGALALIVLLIACFNYMNLSTARSQMRFREVGINKTMGASRKQLALRFFAETGVITGFSLVLAMGLLAIAIPSYNQMTEKQLSWLMLFEGANVAWLLGICSLVVLLAGAYPAIFLTSFLPKNLLQPSFRKNSGAGWFRRSLITTQFTASVVLIIATMVLYKQMQFIQQKKLGFDPEQVVAITTVAAESRDQVNALIQGCNNLSQVKTVCRAQTFPGREASTRTISRSAEDADGYEILTNHVTPGFEKVLGIPLLAGTTLPPKAQGDTLVQVVITQKAADFLGYKPEEAIGKKINCGLGDNTYICGVAADFHAQSLHRPISAYVFHNALTETRRYLLVKLGTNNLPDAMQQLEKVFTSALPNSAFEYQFSG